jgi:hypothetical protein
MACGTAPVGDIPLALARFLVSHSQELGKPGKPKRKRLKRLRVSLIEVDLFGIPRASMHFDKAAPSHKGLGDLWKRTSKRTIKSPSR